MISGGKDVLLAMHPLASGWDDSTNLTVALDGRVLAFAIAVALVTSERRPESGCRPARARRQKRIAS
jgi:hypothetical protein